MGAPRTLKGLILTAATIVSAVLAVGMYATTNRVFDNAVKENAASVSETLAEGTFNAMFQVMRQGWTRSQVEEFIEGVQQASADTPYTIDIYRGDLVTRLFGPIDQKAMDATIHQTLEQGKRFNEELDDRVRHTYPLVARQECLECHTNAKLGSVLGVIDVQQKVDPLAEGAQTDLLVGLALISPLPVLMAFLVALYFQKKITGSMGRLQRNIEKINRISDLKKIEHRELDMGVAEFNEIFRKVDDLADRLRSVAVDKDLLEFEIRLLEKFVITSEVVKDWREYIANLLIDINQVIEAYTLFSIFKVDDELFDLEIFWIHEPEDETRQFMEHAICEALRNNPQLGTLPNIEVNHHVALSDGLPVRLKDHEIELQSKSLMVETPKIGGIVGIGVQSDIVEDQVRLLVTESILSTLLNVVGSVKAIYKYTKDLEYYATRDPLTNLYNQRLFWELLEYEIERAERHDYPFGLLVIDLDNFKSINDTHGHTFGDKFLQAFASAIRMPLGKGDVLARYGGDEFVVILPEADIVHAGEASEAVLSSAAALSLKAPDGTTVKATVSIGVAMFPEHATDMKDLFLFADNMMYKAKSEGKNRVNLPTEDDVIDVFRDIGEKGLIVKNAIEERKFVPFFQPIVNSRSGEVLAVEVLSRIEMDDGRLLGAHEFIEVAERMGIIHELDYTVIDLAFETLERDGYKNDIFVNLSPRALVLGEFIRQLKQLTAKHGIDPTRIVFEITERDTVKNMQQLEKFVIELKSEGFKLAIDDFGAGFSSFHYLKRFPIDYVKIEGDFVLNMVNDPRDAAFVNSISSLAHQLGMATIAEFVENEQVLEAVRAAGIDYAQGYHIGRPSRLSYDAVAKDQA